MNENTTEYVAGLRAAADWIEAHAKVLEAEAEPKGSLGSIGIYCRDGADLAAFAQHLAPATKTGDDHFMQVERRFGPIRIYGFVSRDKVCRKVVKTEMREVEVIEWECDPVLAHLPD